MPEVILVNLTGEDDIKATLTLPLLSSYSTTTAVEILV
jgi:hypothetical protein